MLLSGGIDSATALYLTRKTMPVRALTFEYSGIAWRELESSKAIAERAKVLEHRLVRLPDLKEAGDTPGFDFGGLPATYIPARNAIFYACAASFAEVSGAQVIVGGHNRDDSSVFSDTGNGFFDSLQKALREGSPALRGRRLRIVRPLKRLKKVEVIRLAASLKVPLGYTWSCYRDGEEHCWNCSGCQSRVLSFREAGVRDPLLHIRREKIT